MTSTPTPPPNYSLVPVPRPPENNRNHNHNNSHKRHKNRWSSSIKYAPVVAVVATEFGANGSAAVAGGVQSVGSGRAASYSSALDSLFDGRKSWLPPEFSGRKSTRFASKMHSGMPKVTPNKHAHSNAADEVIHRKCSQQCCSPQISPQMIENDVLNHSQAAGPSYDYPSL
jgi:hypothetical protein